MALPVLMTPLAPLGECSGECRRPWYHYTARNLTTSDPNGLQWRRTPDGAVSYEFFHQDRGSYLKQHPEYCWGSEGGSVAQPKGSGNAWGHASSPDLLHWRTEPVSGICGSSGGGLTLPADFRGPNGERWTSAMIAVGGVAGPRDTNGTGRGLKLWVTNDTGPALRYSMYKPPGTRCYPELHMCEACVICPAGVRISPSNPPPETRTAFLGDSFTWSEPPWHVPSRNRTYFVLSGSGTCAEGKGPPEFCGWGADVTGGAQALLFVSNNLVDWRYVSQYYLNSRVGNQLPPDAGQGSAIMTPDTFTFPTGEQVFIYLGQKNTRWITGTTTRPVPGGEPEHFVERSFGANPISDWVDAGGGTHCGQSFWDPHGRRIQFMWLLLDLPGANWLGAPTLPREIVLAPPGSVTGLLFRPLPEMSLLHAGASSNTSLALAHANGWQDIKVTDGLHAHLLLTIKISDLSTVVSLEIRGAGDKPNAPGSVMLNVTRGTILLGRPSQSPQREVFPTTLTNSGVVDLEIFIDGPVTEVFANGGERALTQNAQVVSIEGTRLRAATNGTATLKAVTWPMRRSVNRRSIG